MAGMGTVIAGRYWAAAMGLAVMAASMAWAETRGGSGTGAPRPDYLAAVKAYAEAMLRDGRDTYGKEPSPLFASALDRRTMKLGTAAQFGPLPGVREHDRSLGGANPQHDVALYALLYELTRLTGDNRYAEEADKALAFFFTHCQSPATGLMAWGEHIYWDFERDAAAWVRHDAHEIVSEWPFWDCGYRLTPEACWRFAMGQWDHQIADQQTGAFSRHARYTSHAPGADADFPRYAGQMIATWADAYGRKENARRERRADLVTAITVLARRMEENMARTGTGWLPALRDADYVWSAGNLELARCLWKAAARIEGEQKELAQRLRALALKQDEHFFKMPHALTNGGGFATTLHAHTGVPRERSSNTPYSKAWGRGYGVQSHAEVALLCEARRGQLAAGHPERAAAHRRMVLAAADVYLTALPPDKAEAPTWPLSLAEAIELMLTAHGLTGDPRYLDRADMFGRWSLANHLDDGLPLPKATNTGGHYESITGGPHLMAALLRLHAATSRARE